MPQTTITIVNESVRVDTDSGFVNLTDMAKLKNAKNASDLLRNWLRTRASILFFIEWEKFHDPQFKTVEFDGFKTRAGDNDFFISVTDLVRAGSTGIWAKAGRYGGTYAHIDWAIHFANWMDPAFYVATLDAFRQLSDHFRGREELHHRFSRELAAKNYNLITAENNRLRLNPPPQPMTSSMKAGDRKTKVKRHLNQVDADIINLAAFGMTAKHWRTRFPPDNPRANMRDFATAEELQMVATLQTELAVLKRDLYNAREALHRLVRRAPELLQFYCDTPEKVARLNATREKRGW